MILVGAWLAGGGGLNCRPSRYGRSESPEWGIHAGVAIRADKNLDDLEGHACLNRRYGRRVGWQGCWAHEYLLWRRG